MSILDTIKANPLPFAIGGIAAVGGIWYYESHKSASSAGTTATPTGATSTGTTGTGGGGGGGGQLAGLLGTLSSDVAALTTAIQEMSPQGQPTQAIINGPNSYIPTPSPSTTGGGAPAPTPSPGSTTPPTAAPAVVLPVSALANQPGNTLPANSPTVQVPVPNSGGVVASLPYSGANPASTPGLVTDLGNTIATNAGLYANTPAGQAAAASVAAGAGSAAPTPLDYNQGSSYVPIPNMTVPTVTAPQTFVSGSAGNGAAANASGKAAAPVAQRTPSSQNRAGAAPSGTGVVY